MRKELLVLCPAKISRAQSRRRWPRGDRKRRSFWILSDGQICNGVSNLTGRCKSEPGRQEESALGEADCRTAGRAEPLTTWRRPRSEPHAWNNRLRSPQGVEEGSMSDAKREYPDFTLRALYQTPSLPHTTTKRLPSGFAFWPSFLANI
jgi:hypothetical protein